MPSEQRLITSVCAKVISMLKLITPEALYRSAELKELALFVSIGCSLFHGISAVSFNREAHRLREKAHQLAVHNDPEAEIMQEYAKDRENDRDESIVSGVGFLASAAMNGTLVLLLTSGGHRLKRKETLDYRDGSTALTYPAAATSVNTGQSSSSVTFTITRTAPQSRSTVRSC